MKVTISDQAALDLRSIGRWIARDNPARSLSFLKELREKCRMLGQRPRAYPLATELRAKDIRKCGHGAYLILYRIEAKAIVVVAVVHGARDYPALFE